MQKALIKAIIEDGEWENGLLWKLMIEKRWGKTEAQ
jgi:hypothetical protein